MATLTIKNLSDDLYEALRRAATAHRRSITREATVLLERALGRVPARHLLVLEPTALPSDWRAPLWPNSTQRIGTRWFEDQDSVVLGSALGARAAAEELPHQPQAPWFRGARDYRADPLRGRPPTRHMRSSPPGRDGGWNRFSAGMMRPRADLFRFAGISEGMPAFHLRFAGNLPILTQPTAMATLTIKNLPDELYEELRRTATAHRRSIIAEATVLLERALGRRALTEAELAERARHLRAQSPPSLTYDELRRAVEEGRA